MAQTAVRERVGGPGLWYALIAGIAFWAVHVTGMAAITPYVCQSGEHVWYHVLSVGTLVPSVVAIWPGWRAWRSDAGAGGLTFLGGMAVLLDIIFSAAILAEWVPVFLVDACAA